MIQPEPATPPPPSLLVVRARWPEIAPFTRAAARERVTVSETSDPTVWFKTVDARGRITGFAGVAAISRSKARIRSVWVKPDFRGLGLGEALSQACFDYAVAARFDRIEILTFDPRWALRAGFTESGPAANGSTRMLHVVGHLSVPRTDPDRYR